MAEAKVVLKNKVKQEWVDYNGHMNDAEYVRAFSWSVDQLMELIGMNETYREEKQYTIFTLENHVCYLAEMKQDEAFEVHLQLLDYDGKRVHVFFELYGEADKRAATSEQMLMGMDQQEGRPATFPDEVLTKVKELAAKHTPEVKPKEAGRVIGIRRKK